MLVAALKKGLFNGFQVTYQMAKIIIPIYIILGFLEALGILNKIAILAEPVMDLVGLPGELSLALVLGNVLNNYAAIGVIAAVDINMKELTIISVMLLFSHSLPIELAVAKKTGVSALGIGILRILTAFIIGIILRNLL